MPTDSPSPKNNFIQVTALISQEEFEAIKDFILKKGDNKTYRNFDNNNPHYALQNFELFLGADIAQRNINNDPTQSDFNQLVIADFEASIRYYELILVRKGDFAAGKAWIRQGMEEEQVYLVDVYNRGLTTMKSALPNYLKQIKEARKNNP